MGIVRNTVNESERGRRVGCNVTHIGCDWWIYVYGDGGGGGLGLMIRNGLLEVYHRWDPWVYG